MTDIRRRKTIRIFDGSKGIATSIEVTIDAETTNRQYDEDALEFVDRLYEAVKEEGATIREEDDG